MKTKRTNRFVAFLLCFVMLLPMVTLPSFAKSPGGIAYPEDAVWYEHFETATTMGDVATSWATLAEIKNSLADSSDKVLSLPIKADDSLAPYLWESKDKKGAFTSYTTTEENGVVTVSGTAKIGSLTYNVTGVLNSGGTLTKATVNSCSGTASTVYVVTGAYADAYGGISNVAKPTFLRNPAWKNADVDAFVIDMQLYLSANAKGVIATQITGTKLEGGATRYLQPFKITANGSSATLGLGDNGEFVSGSAKTLTLGRWHKLTVVIDKHDSAMDIYANGVHAFKAEMKTSSNNYTKVSGPVDIQANSLRIQINRGSAPTNLVGTLQVDDVAFYPSYKASVWSESFEDAKSITDVATTAAVDATVGASLTDAGDTVFSFPVRGTAPEPYYLYKDTSTVPGVITDYSIDAETGKLTGKATVNGLTYNVTGVINTTDATTAATVNSCSGTAEKVYVVTGEVADARRGFLGNVARPVYFKNPAWKNADVEDFVIDLDFYMALGTKGKFATQIDSRTLSTNAKRSIQPYLITATGGDYATVSINGNSQIIKGAEGKIKLGVWNRITAVIDKETSQVSVYTNGKYCFTLENKVSDNVYTKIDEPVNILENTFFIQYNRGNAPANLKGTIQVDDIAFYNSTANLGLSLHGSDFEAYEGMIGSRPTANEGFSRTPNTTVFAKDPANPDNTVIKMEARGNADNKNNHVRNGYTVAPIIDGKVTLDKKVYTPSSTTLGDTNVTLTAEDGSTLTGYQIVTHSEADRIAGGWNVGVAVTPTLPAISYTDTPRIVMQAKYFLSSDMKGVMEIQTKNSGWINCYMINAAGTTPQVKPHETGMTVLSGGAVNVKRGEWFTVHLVFDLVSGQQDVYVNGTFAFAAKYAAAGTNITISASSWYPVKLQRNKAVAGVVYADDLKIYEAEAFLAEPMLKSNYTEDFNAYASSVGKPATIGVAAHPNATYAKDPTDATNTVLKAPLGPVKDATEILMRLSGGKPVSGGFYTVTRNAETNAVEVEGYTVTEENGGTYAITDGTTTYTGLELTTKDVYCAYVGDAAVNSNWKLNHPGYSYTTSRYVTVSADYYISSDARGTFQVQVHTYDTATQKDKAWLGFYSVDTATGELVFAGAKYKVMNKGAWNNISIMIDLKSGNATVYHDHIYIGETDLGDDLFIKAASINFVKQPRQQADYRRLAGYVMVDNFSTGVAKDQTVEIEAKKLMYVEVGNERIYTNRFFLPAGTSYTAKYFDDASYAGMMTTETAASVRLSSPAGLRFATRLDTEKLDALFALADAGEVEKINFGTLIAPTSYISTEFTKEALTANGKKTMFVEATHGRYYAFDKDAETVHFVGSIVNLYKTNVARDFSGRGMVTVTLKTGWEVNIYATAQHSVSVQTVATKALEDTTVNWTEDQRLVLEAFKAGEVAPDAPTVSDLEGLNVLAIGDSLFQGAQNDDGEYQWINVLGRRYNWNLTNLGIGGSTISYQPNKALSNVSIYDRLYNQFDIYHYGSDDNDDARYYNCGDPSGELADVDLILLQAGSNDYGTKVQAPLGTVGSTDYNTFLGAWKLVVDKLLEVYPNATVVMMTAWHNGNQQREDGMQAIPFTSSVVDLYEALYKSNPRVTLIDSGNPEVSGVHMRDSAWRAQYSFDSFHLNNEGMALMADAMTPYIMRVACNVRNAREKDMNGTNVLAIGDSLFGGHSLADGEQWLELLAKDCDWNLTNLGVNGWTVAYNPEAYADPSQVRGSMYNYLMNDANFKFGSTTRGYKYGNVADKTADDVDIIFLEGGWNDYGWNLPLGTDAKSTDGSNYMGAVNAMVAKLLDTYKNAKVVLITSWHTTDTKMNGTTEMKRIDYTANGMKNVYNANYADHDRVYIVDAGDPAVSNVHITDTEWKAQYALDSVHLNTEGMKIMARSMMPIIWRIMQNEN